MRSVLKYVPAALILLLAAIQGHSADQPTRKLEMSSGEGKVLDFAADVARVYTSNPDVADPAAISPREVVVNAKAAGMATLLVWTKAADNEPETRQSFSISVSSDLEPARKLLRETFPSENITLNGSKEALSLVGRVSAQEVSDRAVALLKPFAQSVVSNVEVVTPKGLRQVGLHVIFAELDRNATDSFAVNLLSTGGGNTVGRTSTGQFAGPNPTQVPGNTFNLSNALNIFAFRPDLNIGATITDLQNKGVLQILAEPNLVTSEAKKRGLRWEGSFRFPWRKAGQLPARSQCSSGNLEFG